MNHIGKLLIILALSLTTMTSYAGTSFGTPNCGQWIKENSATQKAWVLGFVSGLNTVDYVMPGENDWLDKVDSAEQIYLWIDNYCKENPLEKLNIAGFMLRLELLRKK